MQTALYIISDSRTNITRPFTSVCNRTVQHCNFIIYLHYVISSFLLVEYYINRMFVLVYHKERRLNVIKCFLTCVLRNVYEQNVMFSFAFMPCKYYVCHKIKHYRSHFMVEYSLNTMTLMHILINRTATQTEGSA